MPPPCDVLAKRRGVDQEALLHPVQADADLFGRDEHERPDVGIRARIVAAQNLRGPADELVVGVRQLELQDGRRPTQAGEVRFGLQHVELSLRVRSSTPGCPRSSPCRSAGHGSSPRCARRGSGPSHRRKRPSCRRGATVCARSGRVQFPLPISVLSTLPAVVRLSATLSLRLSTPQQPAARRWPAYAAACKPSVLVRRKHADDPQIDEDEVLQQSAQAQQRDFEMASRLRPEQRPDRAARRCTRPGTTSWPAAGRPGA